MNPNPEDWKDEIYKAYVAKWRAYEAEESERRRREGKIAIWLERSPDDAETFTKEHQAELRGVVGAIREKGVELEAPFMAVDAVDAVSGYTGELIIAITSIPAIAQVLVAWVKRKSGSKLRVEFHPDGKLKSVEAQTEKQVLSIAEALEREGRAKGTKAKKAKKK
jgi:hypothetical protein